MWIASHPPLGQSINGRKDASAARLRQGGRTTAFCTVFWQGLAGIERFWQASRGILMEHSTAIGVLRASTVEENGTMFGWALTFLIVALIAAVLGFGGIAGFAVEIAQLIFYVAIILLVISVVVGLIRGRTTTVP
jgi:uncharacterized membrane protein YtjA (UPF0391 family)